MFEALLGIIALFAVSVLLFFLAVRALRLRLVVLRWISVVLSGLLGLVVGALAVMGLIGVIGTAFPRIPPPHEFTASTDPQVIARGEYLATILCTDCHSPDMSLPLAGGRNILEDAPMPLGFAPAYNLTPAGPLKDWTDAEIFRAIRHNIDADGRKLVVMNFTGIGSLGDKDIEALVAYLRSQPATGEETRKEKLTTLAYLMGGAGMIPSHTWPDSIDSPAPTPDVVYGKYITGFLSCSDCHGPDLNGGTGGLTPAGPSLVQSLSTWSEDDFVQAMRTGKRPDGRQLVAELMPYETYGKAHDTELKAIYAYIRSLK